MPHRLGPIVAVRSDRLWAMVTVRGYSWLRPSKLPNVPVRELSGLIVHIPPTKCVVYDPWSLQGDLPSQLPCSGAGPCLWYPVNKAIPASA